MGGMIGRSMWKGCGKEEGNEELIMEFMGVWSVDKLTNKKREGRILKRKS